LKLKGPRYQIIRKWALLITRKVDTQEGRLGTNVRSARNSKNPDDRDVFTGPSAGTHFKCDEA